MNASGKRIENWLGSVVPQIVKQAAPLRILLFGSAVRNPNGAVNDLDFLVVVPDRDRPSRIMDRLNSGVRNKPIPCDFLVATPSVLAQHVHRRDSIYKTALSEGQEVYVC
jgi:uncharacterized protein